MSDHPQRSSRASTWSGKRSRDNILAQWRGIDLREQERAGIDSVRDVRGVVAGVLKDLGLDQRLSQLEILKVWNSALDPDIVAHAQPTALKKGTLFVTVDSNVWMHEILRYRNKEILKRLQHSFGSDLIARISYRI